MFKSFFNSTLRNLWRNKVYTAINVLGLSVGLAGFVLIMIYVRGELSYDRHHPDAENIYRVAMRLEMSGNIIEAAVSGGMLGMIMYDEIKEVKACTRMVHYPRSVLLANGAKKIFFEDVLYADSSFFQFFHYDILLGDADAALQEPYSLVLTESGAEKLFGEVDPIGKEVEWNSGSTYIVRAVIKDPYQPTHIHFGALASFSTLESIPPFDSYINSLSAFVTLNYIRLHDGIHAEDIQAPLDTLVARHMMQDAEASGAGFNFYLQPVRDIYLHSHLRHEMKANGDIKKVYIFSAIALFILLIACINFITLTTARSVKRSMEVGVRKVFGAARKTLITQFLFESVVMALFSMLVAIVFIELMLGELNQLAGTDLSGRAGIREYLLVITALSVVIGVLSGLYPAFIISAFSPLRVIQKRLSGGHKTSWFRNIMIIIQFVITIFLICGSIIIYLQLDHIGNKDTGISLEDRLVIPLRGSAMIRKYPDLKARLLNVTGVESVTASSTYPGRFGQRRSYYPEGFSRNDMWMLQNVQVDHDYFEVMNIQLIEGRSFSKNPSLDSLCIIVNEALVKESGWDQPIGKYVALPAEQEVDDVKLHVIGVVADFNYASLHETVKPLLIMHEPTRLSNITVKINPAALPKTLKELEKEWNTSFLEQPFNYFMLKEQFDQQYSSDRKLLEVFTWFTLIAIFIACMGLFGLSSFMTAQRTREIGIRKVLGASVARIILVLIKVFLVLVLIASAIAIPLSVWGMQKWLQNFAEQTSLHWWIFPLGGFIAMMVAILTVFSQSYKAANKNPVDAIRWE
jgi:putative ABC transport system permease protein